MDTLKLNDVLYIPLHIHNNTFCLGVFTDLEEAQNTYTQFLIKHPNFQEWFESAKEIYQKSSSQEEYYLRCNELTMENFHESILEDGDFWACKFEIYCDIQTILPGKLFEFYMWGNWVMKESADFPPEYNNLYNLVNGCLLNRPYKVDLDLYVKHYPII